MAGVRPKQCGFDPNLADARLRKRNSTNLSTWSNWASDSMAWTLISAAGGLRTGTKRGKRGVSRHRQADAAGSVLENQLVSGVVHITKEQAAARRISHFCFGTCSALRSPEPETTHRGCCWDELRRTRTRSSLFTFERSGEDTWPGGGGDCC